MKAGKRVEGQNEENTSYLCQKLLKKKIPAKSGWHSFSKSIIFSDHDILPSSSVFSYNAKEPIWLETPYS